MALTIGCLVATVTWGDVAARINARWRNGQPSNPSAEAGVTIRILDRLGNHDRQWLPNEEDARHADRWSASIINKHNPYTYEGPPNDLANNPGTEGFILDPAAVDATLLCAYPRDGGSLGMECVGWDGQPLPWTTNPGAECVPGCRLNWCPGRERWWGCAYRGSSQRMQKWGTSQLGEALWVHHDFQLGTAYNEQGERIRGGYNELVIDLEDLVANHYPYAIEAIFYKPRGGDESKARARRHAEAFAAAFGLESLPLLRYDVDEPDAPFVPPTDDWSAAGVLIRVLDGDGVTMHGFANELDLNDPLAHAWAFNPNAWKGGDRASSTLVNARHPDIFRCLVGCVEPSSGAEMKDLPGIVLRPSPAVVSRVSCMSWFDGGSLNHNCRPLDPTGGCVGGCPRGRDASGATLRAMLAAQDANVVPWGACANQRDDCDYHITAERYWNEVVIDKYRQPWDADITSMVDAVAISPHASDASMRYARQVHHAFTRLFTLKGVDNPPPLLLYDAASTDGTPFRLPEDST